jgi:hypothetical protein
MNRTEPILLGLTRTEWLLAVTVILFVGLLVHPYRAQQASRYALTAAVVERGTVVLDDYEPVLGRDKAVRDGHVYSDKAPGQPMLAVPFFALGKAFGVEEATVLRVNGNLGLWWITLWASAIPGAALAVMMYRRSSSLRCRGALMATGAAYAGTLLLPFSALLFGHVLAAALLYGSFLLLLGGHSPWRLAISGALASLAVSVEYTAALGVVILAVYTFWRHGSAAWAWVVGGIPLAIALAGYNWVAFGDPFTFSYQYSAFHEVTESSRPVLGMFSSGTIENFIRLSIHGRGLLVATPIVIVAVVGAVSALFRESQADLVMGVVMFVVYLALPIFWGNPWGGASPGPRYMLLALPFLAVPIARAWEQWPRLTTFFAGLSVLTMTTATITEPLLPRDSVDGLNTWLQRLVNGEVTDTVFSVGLGQIGWLPHILVMVLSVGLLLGSHRRRCDSIEGQIAL